MFGGFVSFSEEIIFRLFYNLGEMSKIRRWYDFYHLIVESVLLGLDLLDWRLKELNLVNWHQWTFVIIIILFFPKLSLILTFFPSVFVFIIFIFILIFISFFFIIFYFVIVDSLLSILSYHFYQCLKNIRKYFQHKLRLLRMLH